MGWGSHQSKGGKDTRSPKGKGGKGSKGGGKGSKGDKGGRDSQGSKDGKGHPDGGLSPPGDRPAKQPKPRVGGISLKEGGWRLVPLPDDRVLKVLVPFLGNALCEADEKWITLKGKWEKDFNVDIDLRGRKSRGGQSVGSSIARDLVIIGPDYDCVRDAFDAMLDRAAKLKLQDVHEIQPPEMWLKDRKTKKETRSEDHDPDMNMPRPDNEARLNPDPPDGGVSPPEDADEDMGGSSPEDADEDMGGSSDAPAPRRPKDIFAGRVVKLVTGGWKRFSHGRVFKTNDLKRIAKLEEAPPVEQIASALQAGGWCVDYIWDCGLAEDGPVLPLHLGFFEAFVELQFAKWDRIEQHLAAVHKLFRDTNSTSPIHIFFLSRLGMVRSVAAASIMQLALKEWQRRTSRHKRWLRNFQQRQHEIMQQWRLEHWQQQQQQEQQQQQQQQPPPSSSSSRL